MTEVDKSLKKTEGKSGRKQLYWALGVAAVLLSLSFVPESFWTGKS